MEGLLSLVQDMTLPEAADVQQGGQIESLMVNEWAIYCLSVGIYCPNIVFGSAAFGLDRRSGFIRGIECEGQRSEALESRCTVTIRQLFLATGIMKRK